MLLLKLTSITRVRFLSSFPGTALGLVLALSAGLYFARLGDRALWTMELRWAEIPREMVQSGNYFRPTINSRLYYDKPLGSYWLVLAASWLTGSVGELTARIPSAVSGLAGVALLMGLARRLYDDRTAALAGLILATSFGYVFFARHASSDMETVAGVLAALALYLRNRRRDGRWWVVGLWLVMAMTSLTKGLLGFALPLLVIVIDVGLTYGRDQTTRGPRGWIRAMIRGSSWLFSRHSLVGCVLAAVVYLGPFAASGADAGAGLSLVVRENVQRFVAPHNHRGPVYLYAYVIFGLLAPWAAFLPAAICQAHARHRGDGLRAGDRFVRVYFWATFLFFTLSASRRSYYLLPVLPAGALLVARLLTTPPESLSQWARRALRFGLGALTVAVAVSGVAVLPPAWVLPAGWAALPPAPERVALALGWSACLAALIQAARHPRPMHAAGATGLVAVLAMAYVFGVVLPATEPYRGERPFTAAVREAIGPGLRGLALYRTRELVYYLDACEPIPEFDALADLGPAVRRGDVRYLILRRRDLEGLNTPAAVLAEETTYLWDGPAERQAKAMLLRLY